MLHLYLIAHLPCSHLTIHLAFKLQIYIHIFIFLFGSHRCNIQINDISRMHTRGASDTERQIAVDEYVSSHEMIERTCTTSTLVYGIILFVRLWLYFVSLSAAVIAIILSIGTSSRDLLLPQSKILDLNRLQVSSNNPEQNRLSSGR